MSGAPVVVVAGMVDHSDDVNSGGDSGIGNGDSSDGDNGNVVGSFSGGDSNDTSGSGSGGSDSGDPDSVMVTSAARMWWW